MSCSPRPILLLRNSTIEKVYCGLFHFASEKLDVQAFAEFRHGMWPTRSTNFNKIRVIAYELMRLAGRRRPAQFCSRASRRLQLTFHIVKYNIPVAKLTTSTNSTP